MKFNLVNTGKWIRLNVLYSKEIYHTTHTTKIKERFSYKVIFHINLLDVLVFVRWFDWIGLSPYKTGHFFLSEEHLLPKLSDTNEDDMCIRSKEVTVVLTVFYVTIHNLLAEWF